MNTPHNPLICAIDTTDPWAAGALARNLRGSVGAVKLGLEFYTANGRKGISEVIAQQVPLFLDLKFHDIPNTVHHAVRATAGLNVRMMTVHCGGGEAMLRAAMEASMEVAEHTGQARPMILGVTVLTSLEQSDLKAIGVNGDVSSQVSRLAELAAKCGLDGVVCSPQELETLRATHNDEFLLVTPGIRPAGAQAHDQKRTMTPEEAIKKGASYIVVGRPITEASDPVRAAKQIAGIESI